MLPLAPQLIEAADPVAALTDRANRGPEPERQLVRFRSAAVVTMTAADARNFGLPIQRVEMQARRSGEPPTLAIRVARRGRIVGEPVIDPASTPVLARARLRRDQPAEALARILVPEEPGARLGAAHPLVWALFAGRPDRRRDFLWREMRPV